MKNKNSAYLQNLYKCETEVGTIDILSLNVWVLIIHSHFFNISIIVLLLLHCVFNF